MSEDHHGFDEEDVRRRAYEISLRPDAGSPEANWLRAVDELRLEHAAASSESRPRPEPEPPFPPNTSALTHP
jgi:hypothetical protein